MAVDSDYQLGDRYGFARERGYLTGVQAIVRLLLAQHHRDAAAGNRTAGFVSGYRGSPLGTVDLALWQVAAELEAADIKFQPGINEDLAATAIWGSQQAALLDGATHDGVFGLWYGKGPGVDRSCDALKHANFAGTAPLGGVLAIAGDDHGAKSSTLAHQSEHALIHCGIPILHPADVQDILDLGIHGWAMSRYAGCWVSLKVVTDVVDSSQSVDLRVDRVQTTLPQGFPTDVHIRYATPALPTEATALGARLQAAKRYAAANRLDRIRFGASEPRHGIVTSGKAYGDVLQALAALDIDEEEARKSGLAVYKVGMSWPLEPTGLRAFAEPLDRMLVIEEKRPVLEDQICRLLYHTAGAPILTGKFDADDRPVLPDVGELDPVVVADAIAGWLGRSKPHRRTVVPLALSAGPTRAPAFCAGCPHNRSTVVPDGSVAHGGIGCHGMATFETEQRALSYTHMGGEGANWIGHSPFTTTDHIFQNLGDGTYTHSGLLAIRAAVAAGVNITYKVLVNGAVAMTGGQPVEGHAPLDGPEIVGTICQQVLAEGAATAVVVTDAPEAHKGRLPRSVKVHHRDDLDAVQRQLREVPGVTVLVYDQVCAAEARRLRKRGRMPSKGRRIVIQEDVCEGCGDCSVQSNCIAIEPVETALGRKRRINQDACNEDESCLRGYCPSFAVLTNAVRRRPSAQAVSVDDLFTAVPDAPVAPTDRPWSVLITGIGGTGVVTVGALLGVAAHLEGRACSVLDMTGLAQKNGPVASHVRVAAEQHSLGAARIAAGGADAIIGCDIVTTATPDILAKSTQGRTRVLVEQTVTPTAEFRTNPDLDLSSRPMEHAIVSAVGEDAFEVAAAGHLAQLVFGESVTANVILLGMAAQRGMLPVSTDALERAIELNGTKVDQNLRAFRLGRAAAHDPASVEARIASGTVGLAAAEESAATESEAVEDVIAHRRSLVQAWGGRRAVRRFDTVVGQAQEAEEAVVGAAGQVTLAVARTYARLLAYKDEYEVARLWTDPATRRRLDDEFEPGYRIHLNLAPQRFFPVDKATGRAKKVTFAPWMLGGMRLLAKARVLRATPLDVFGRTPHRRRERQLVVEYEELVREVVAGLDGSRTEEAVELLSIAAQIRGFGLIKDASIATVKSEEASLLSRWRAGSDRPMSAHRSA